MSADDSSTTQPDRWYTIVGFQFSRRQAQRAALLFTLGVVAFCVAFTAWYLPPRATSRLIRSVGGSVTFRYNINSAPRIVLTFLSPMRTFGFTETDQKAEWVDITQSKVTDEWLVHLKPLESLKHLHIHERQLGPGLGELAELTELNNIGIWQLSKGNLEHLKLLPYLSSVVLIQSNVSDVDLSSLAQLPQLNSLQFSSTVITAETLRQASTIRSLTSLNMYQTNLDADVIRGMEHLTRLPMLQHLHINVVNDELARAISKLSSLTYLSIQEGDLTDEGAASLAQLTNLRGMYLTNSLRQINVDALRKQMPQCQITFNLKKPSGR